MTKAVPFICGYCGKPAAVSVSTTSPNGWVDEESALLRTIADCSSCNNVSYIEIEAPEVQVPRKRAGIVLLPGESFLDRSLAVRNQFPGPFKRPPENTPEDVSNSYIEAQRCLWAESPAGSLVLCRRSIEIAVVQQGVQFSTLISGIEELGRKGQLSGDLVELAHGIRVLGNEGAHATGQAYKGVSQQDAKDVIEFTEAFLQGVYSIPALAGKATRRRTGRRSGR